MLSGVGCVAKGGGNVGVFGVPENAGRGGLQRGEEKQEREVWPPRWQHGSFLCVGREGVCAILQNPPVFSIAVCSLVPR